MKKEVELEKTAQEIARCSTCKKNGVGLPVPGEGNPDAEIIFVGEAPGKQEAATGRPFVGRSGQVLRKMIREVGLKEEDVYITSPVKYLPVYKTPKSADILHAKIHFDKQLAVIDPKIVVLLGAVAIQAVLGEKLPVLKQHGTTIERNGRIYFLTLHPAAVLRNPRLLPTFLEDFHVLKRMLAE